MTGDWKVCPRCEVAQPRASFSSAPRNRDGLYGWCKACQNDYQKRKHSPDKARAKYLKRTHGMTVEQYDVMFDAQGGLCAACSLVPKRAVVDHDHTTGAVRAILCNECNISLGLLRESPERMRQLSDYILSFQSVISLA